jgi:hypothetical protein
MRDCWYGDDRDVVKWSAVLHLARREKMVDVLYVAMYRPDEDWPPLATARGPVALPDEVVRHFRDLDDLQRLGARTGLCIATVREPFVDRAAYFRRLCERVRKYAAPVLVLLDPDTGLAPDSGAGPQHVTSDEVAVLFAALRTGDLLACYQHARRQKDWRGRARRAFANAPGVPSFEVEMLRSDLARDVLLLAVKKGE